MRPLAAVILAALVFAGCSDPPPAAGLGFTHAPEHPVVGETVVFTPVGGPAEAAGGIVWSWDFGDGASADQRTPQHVFAAPGTYPVRASYEADSGESRSVTQAVTIHPVGAAPTGGSGGGTSPTPGQATPTPGGATPTPGDATPTPGGPSPTPAPDVIVSPMEDWGDPEGKAIRPGINTVFEGGTCTSNFVFTDGTDLYLGSAAHCLARGTGAGTNGCTTATAPLGSPVTLVLDGGGEQTGRLAYSSWVTMQANDVTDEDTCEGNDFALILLDESQWPLLHPAPLHFDAVTGLADGATPDLWGYGASPTWPDVATLHAKRGLHVMVQFDGWSHLVYLAAPGIPGDSGGFIMTADGAALGVGSSLLVTPFPGANHYTDIPKALEYAAAHGGLTAALVAWGDWDPPLI